MSSRTFFTADTHFGHEGIIRSAGRPFGSLAEMERELITRWNAVVQPTDTVWHLGDFAHRGDDRIARRAFQALNGEKHLILGNHDGPRTAELPWASVETMAEIAVDGQRLVLMHYGMRVWPGQRRGALHLYGHSHGRLPGCRLSCDVGVDEWGYRPVTLDEIKQRLARQPEVEPEILADGPAL